jgi:hypothetical protein
MLYATERDRERERKDMESGDLGSSSSFFVRTWSDAFLYRQFFRGINGMAKKVGVMTKQNNVARKNDSDGLFFSSV